MLAYRDVKTFGCAFRAAAKVAPLSTAPRISIRAFLNTLFSCWDDRISRHCTSGSPASIMVANCRVKITMSFSVTPPPNPGMVSSLGLPRTTVAMTCWDRSRATTASRLAASISPVMVWPPRVRPV